MPGVAEVMISALSGAAIGARPASVTTTSEPTVSALREVGERRFAVKGTPTDCVHLAISGLFDFELGETLTLARGVDYALSARVADRATS